MALTEKYVSSLAGGSGDGTSAGTAYTFAQMKAEVNAGILGPGTRYNIKADGTYTLSGGQDMGGVDGTLANPIVFRGYKTTPGDGYLGRTGTNGPLITTNMPVFAPDDFFGTPGYSIVESIRIAGSRGDTMYKLQRRSYMVNCVVSNSNTGSGSWAMEVTEFCVVFESDILLTATSGPTEHVMKTVAQGGKIDSCRIISSCPTAGGIRSDWACSYYACLIKGAGGANGIRFESDNRDAIIRNCTITGWQDGISNNAVTQLPIFVAGCMITDNAGWG